MERHDFLKQSALAATAAAVNGVPDVLAESAGTHVIARRPSTR